jgi:hypothetical protein
MLNNVHLRRIAVVAGSGIMFCVFKPLTLYAWFHLVQFHVHFNLNNVG